MKSIFEQNHVTYTLGNDGIYYPNIVIPEEEKVPLGKYGMMRFDYLRTERPSLFNSLLLTGKLYSHLHEIDTAAHSRMELIMKQEIERNHITEQLKAEHQMEWVQKMNTAKHIAEEMILEELIYC